MSFKTRRLFVRPASIPLWLLLLTCSPSSQAVVQEQGNPPTPAPNLPAGITEVTGTIEDIIACDFQHRSERWNEVVEDGTGARYRLQFDSETTKHHRTGERVRVRGRRANGVIQVGDGVNASTSSLEVLTGALVQGGGGGIGAGSANLIYSGGTNATTNVRQTLVMMINYTNWTRFTAADIVTYSNKMFSTTLQSVNAEFLEQTYGKVGFSGKVLICNIQADMNACPGNGTGWFPLADAEALAQGENPANYTHKVYFVSGSCGWAGLAAVGGNWSQDYYLDGGTISHELGHNLGFNHAAAQWSNGTWDEYGDSSDFMGSSYDWRHNNGPHKVKMGWVTPQTITNVGVYQISRLEDVPSSVPYPQVLTFSSATAPSGWPYYLSYKQAVGFDAGIGSYSQGLSIHRWAGGAPAIIALLSDGASFFDSATGKTIRQISHDINTVTIGVANCLAGAEPVTLIPTASQLAAQTPLTVDVTAMSTCDPLSVTTFNVTSVKGGTVTLTNNQLIYTPPVSFTGNDTFNYTVLDTLGISSSSVVTIINVSQPQFIWDSNGDTAGTGGSGTWNTVSPAWDNGAQVWPSSGASNYATFGGAAGTVSIAAGGVSANGLIFNADGYVINSNTLTLNGTTPRIITGSDVVATINATVSGTAGMVKDGAGTLMLAGTNTVTGGATLSVGKLILGGASGAALGSGDLTIAPASGWSGAANGVELATGQSFGTVHFTGTDNSGLRLNGMTATVTGLDCTNSKGIIENGGYSQGVNSSGTLIVNAASASSFNGLIRDADSGGGLGKVNLVKSGAGTLTLLATNTHTGTTTVRGGTLTAGSATALSSGSAVVITNGTLNVASSGGQLNWYKNVPATTVQTGGTLTLAGSATEIHNLTLAGGTLAGSNPDGNYGSWGFNTSTTVEPIVVTGGVTSTISALKIDSAWGNPLTFNVDSGSALNITSSLGGNPGHGTFGVTKLGGGTMTLATANAYTGATVVSNGTLLVTGSIGAGGVTVASGALGGTGTVNGATTVQNGGTLSPGTTAAIGTLSVSNTLALSGTAFMRLNQTSATSDKVRGVTTLTYGGNLVVSNLSGTLAAGNTFTLFSAVNYNGAFAGATLPVLATNLVWDLSLLTVDGSIRVAAVTGINPPPAPPSNVVASAVSVSQINVSWAAASNATTYQVIRGGTPVGIVAGTNFVDGGLSSFTTYCYTVIAMNSGGVSTPSSSACATTPVVGATIVWDANNVTAGAQDGGGIWGNSAAQWLYSGTDTFWVDGNTASIGVNTTTNCTVTITNDVTPVGIIFNATGGGSYTLASGGGGINLNGAPQIVSSNNATISAPLQGSGALTKMGPSTLTLSGTNTYAGGTTVNRGTLVAGSSGALPAGAVLVSNATLNVASSLDQVNWYQVISNTTVKAGGTLTLAGSATEIHNLTLAGGALAGNNPHGIYGSWGFNTPGSVEPILVTGGVVSTISALKIDSAWGNALTFNVDAGSTLNVTGTIGGNSGHGAFGVTKLGTGTMSLSGANGHTGGTVVQAGTLVVGGSAALPSGGAVTVGSNATLNVNSAAGQYNWYQFVSATTVQPGGILTLGGAATEIHNLTLAGGTLAGSSPDANYGSWGFNHNSGAIQPILVTGSVTSTISALKFDAAWGTALAFNVDSNSTLNVTGTIGGNAGHAAFGLHKLGAGTMILAGVNAYTGATAVSNGTLRVNGSLNASSAVTVVTNATLGGSGTVAGAVTINGTIAPGTTVGTLTTGAEIWNGGGNYLCEINSTNATGSDRINLSGALTVNATTGNRFTVKVASLTTGNAPGNLNGFNPSQNYSWTIASATSLSGFDPVKFTINTAQFINAFTGTFSITNSGSTVVLKYSAPAIPAVPPLITGSALLPGGQFQLTFTGSPGQSFSVRSTNTMNAPRSTWPVLTNGTIGVSGVATFTDPAIATNSQQFYLISSP